MNKLLKRRGDMSDLNLTGKGKVRAQFSQNSSFWIFGYENVFREQSNMANTGFSILTKTFLNTNVFDNASSGGKVGNCPRFRVIGIKNIGVYILKSGK